MKITVRRRWRLPAATFSLLVTYGGNINIASGQLSRVDVTPESACVEFVGATDGPTAWTAQECLDVWNQWYDSVPRRLQAQTLDNRQVLREVSDELRRAGKPCYVRSEPTPDGAGSSTIRHIASWMFAVEMGCEWVTPDYGAFRQVNELGLTYYCHRADTIDEKALQTMEQRKAARAMSCILVNWAQYFSFGSSAVAFPASGVVKDINGDNFFRWEDVNIARREIQSIGVDHLPWEHMLVSFSKGGASSYLMSVQSWDEHKRSATRSVLETMRANFHAVPRQGYDDNPHCAFSTSSLNFAIHVRMGDRRQFQGISVQYYRLLETLMATLTAGAVEMGQPPPIFHVFSETRIPCPDTRTGLFEEFPLWPVEMDQIQLCLEAKTPDDCPEKRAGSEVCQPERSGIFKIQEKPLILHVGNDVITTMTCMAKSDGLMVGCSTFGQVAGLLSEGLRFFSMHCGGERTPAHYKMMPPIAVAERGKLWVPVTGSWHDPVLYSEDLYKRELRMLLHKKGMLS